MRAVAKTMQMMYNQRKGGRSMEYSVRWAKAADLLRIEEIYAQARAFMAENGNPNQWGSNYPPVEQLRRDISEENLFVITAEDVIHGVFYFAIGEDPTYQIIDGAWRSVTPYGTIHRIAGDGSGGILTTAVAYARGKINHLRIDTHADNQVMQRAVAKLGFQRRGIIHLEDGSPRIAYDYLNA